jgi:hypothetical protein
MSSERIEDANTQNNLIVLIAEENISIFWTSADTHSSSVYYNPFFSTNCLQSLALSFILFPSSILYFSKLKPTSLQAKIIDIPVILEAANSVQILCKYFYS